MWRFSLIIAKAGGVSHEKTRETPAFWSRSSEKSKVRLQALVFSADRA
jgi:hypothetical protein